MTFQNAADAQTASSDAHPFAPVVDWRDYIPLAKAETSKFYRKQERARFRYDELLGVAVEALGNAATAFDCTRNNGLAAYAIKGIRGALNDYARDAYKVVRNVETSEEEYHQTRGRPPAKQPPPTILRVCGWALRNSDAGPLTHRQLLQEVLGCADVPADTGKLSVRHTYFTDGPHRSNSQLLEGVYKVNSKHGKVSVAIGRSSYNDEWDQTFDGWKRAKIEEEEPTSGRDPRSRASLADDG
jgi:hypothetical protein